MNGNFTMVSPSGARLLGFSSPAEMIGLPISRLCADPEDVNAFMKALSKTGSLSGYQLVLRSRDGTPHYFITNSRQGYLLFS
jgi:PAS domain-containing protein